MDEKWTLCTYWSNKCKQDVLMFLGDQQYTTKINEHHDKALAFLPQNTCT